MVNCKAIGCFKLQLNFWVYANSKSTVQLHEVLRNKVHNKYLGLDETRVTYAPLPIWQTKVWMKQELHMLLCLYGKLSAPTL